MADIHALACACTSCAQEFEFFAAFSPLVEKEVAMATCTHLVNDWLHQERDKLFLLHTHTY